MAKTACNSRAGASVSCANSEEKNKPCVGGSVIRVYIYRVKSWFSPLLFRRFKCRICREQGLEFYESTSERIDTVVLAA